MIGTAVPSGTGRGCAGPFSAPAPPDALPESWRTLRSLFPGRRHPCCKPSAPFSARVGGSSLSRSPTENLPPGPASSSAPPSPVGLSVSAWRRGLHVLAGSGRPWISSGCGWTFPSPAPHCPGPAGPPGPQTRHILLRRPLRPLLHHHPGEPAAVHPLRRRRDPPAEDPPGQFPGHLHRIPHASRGGGHSPPAFSPVVRKQEKRDPHGVPLSTGHD